MKNLLLFTVFSLITIGAIAQEKANHNTSRSNKTTGGKVDPSDTNTYCRVCKTYTDRVTPNTYTRLSKADAKIAIPAFMKYIRLKGDTDGSEARILERTECVKAGSTFYELTDGTTICLPASVSAKSQNLPSEKTDNDKFHPCLRSCIGILVTNSTGTAYYKKVTEVYGKSKK
ncbi:MAG: hypothetical protein ACI83H_002002 [Glaciecola sp.]|jgi:hypothetical protein